ncbi:cobalamin B12-binding domain-containing protein [Spiribacter halobius]|uniref:cobalamin B12-binding domain-containing protein n=1 Tax=Sediminicurvatus halobius TaxID=2182432 RepID=UPI001304E9C2|nr:cobalamin-dependent protein [Spiribacter halobius]UEX77277.1 cobalamin-dependent protein [Spiribacter halobius]
MSVVLARQITERSEAISGWVVASDYARRPELLERYGERGRELYLRDNAYHLSFLAEAVASGEPALFVDYVAWAKSMLLAHGVLVEDLVHNLRLLREALAVHLQGDDLSPALAPLDSALARLPDLPDAPPTFIDEGGRNAVLAQEYLERLLQGRRRDAGALIERALGDGVPLRQVYLDVFQRTQREVGRLWQLNRITVAEEHYCSAATQVLMSQLYPLVLEAPRNGRSVTAFCVADDLHEIGLRIVADFLELAGWDCDYIGANTPGAALIRQLERRTPDLVAVSVTMPYHVRALADFVEALRARPALAELPILVGGRPFLITDNLWQRIGASGWAADAEAAVDRADELVRGAA